MLLSMLSQTVGQDFIIEQQSWFEGKLLKDLKGLNHSKVLKNITRINPNAFQVHVFLDNLQ